MFPFADRRQALTPLIAVVTLPLGILAAMFVSVQLAGAVFVVGWLLLVPLTAILFGPPANEFPFEADTEGQPLSNEETRHSSANDPATDPVEEARQRYARGEIDEVELERRLETLLETEDVDSTDPSDVRNAAERIDTGRSAESSTDAGGETLTEEN